MGGGDSEDGSDNSVSLMYLVQRALRCSPGLSSSC